MKTLLVTVDAVRADHLGQFGYDRDTMPVLDDLLADGVLFESAFANGTNTGVSLPSMLTSRYAGAESAREGPTLASACSAAGVTTAGFHSNTLLANRVGRVAGFDHFEDFGTGGEDETTEEGSASVGERAYDRLVETLRPVTERLGVRPQAERVQEFLFPDWLIHEPSVYTDAETLTDELLAWVRVHRDEEFLVWAHYMDPHRPYGVDVDDPAFGEPADEGEIEGLMSKAGVSPGDVTPAERRRLIDLYDSDLKYTSRQLSRLFDGLREAGVWEETATVLTADHGEEFDDHGYYYHRNRPYDELLHVPLVVRHPDRDLSGLDTTEQRELLDVAPTVCGFHDADAPAAFRGRRLSESGDRQVVATGSFVEQRHVVAGRWGGWKYISLRGGDTELFDLTADPDEREDRSADEPDRLAHFESAIPTEALEGEAREVSVEDSGVEQRLADLGYME